MQSWGPQPRLRQKRSVDTKMTDKELFQNMPLGDLWSDAQLVSIYKYLRQSKKTTIPDTWVDVFENLDAQLDGID